MGRGGKYVPYYVPEPDMKDMVSLLIGMNMLEIQKLTNLEKRTGKIIDNTEYLVCCENSRRFKERAAMYLKNEENLTEEEREKAIRKLKRKTFGRYRRRY